MYVARQIGQEVKIPKEEVEALRAYADMKRQKEIEKTMNK